MTAFLHQETSSKDLPDKVEIFNMLQSKKNNYVYGCFGAPENYRAVIHEWRHLEQWWTFPQEPQNYPKCTMQLILKVTKDPRSATAELKTPPYETDREQGPAQQSSSQKPEQEEQESSSEFCRKNLTSQELKTHSDGFLYAMVGIFLKMEDIHKEH